MSRTRYLEWLGLGFLKLIHMNTWYQHIFHFYIFFIYKNPCTCFWGFPDVIFPHIFLPEKHLYKVVTHRVAPILFFHFTGNLPSIALSVPFRALPKGRYHQRNS